MAFGPVVAGAALAKNEVVRAEELTIGSTTHGIHRAGLKVDKDSAGDVLFRGGLVVVDADAVKLLLGGANVGARGVDAMLIRDYLPELGANLVAALASLKVDNFAHVDVCKG